MRKYALAALLTLAAIIAPAPGIAFHDDSTPLLGSGSATGEAWAAYRFTTDGGKVVGDIEATNVSWPIQGGVLVYDTDGRVAGGAIWTVLEKGNGVLVNANLTPEHQVQVSTLQPVSTEAFGVGIRLNNPDLGPPDWVGEFTFLMWIGGTAERTEHSLRGVPGVGLAGRTSGSHTFLYTSKDFKGLANVQVGDSNANARLNAKTSVTIEARQTLIGNYRSVGTGADQMSVDRPSGPHPCPCSFLDFTPVGLSTPFGPGTYTFNLSGAGAGTTNLHEIVLGGADALLP